MNDALAFATAIAREAGRCTLDYFGRADLRVERKADDSPVTEADRAAERLLRERIEQAFPEDGILGEEFGEKASSNGRRWILDPIDGTKSFERAVPLYGTLVALEEGGAITTGVIHMPALGEEVHAARGEGATWVTGLGTDREDSKPARVSATTALDQALFCLTSPGDLEVLEPLIRAVSVVRGWGDCYAHLLVATGRADLAVDPRFAVWDAAPLKIVVEEAGGRFTDRTGAPTHLGGSGVSTNGALHDEVLRILPDASSD